VVRLAWVTFAGGVVIVALYVFGTQHAPSYTFGLFGQRGAHAVRLKSQIATGVLGLALVQLLLALWMYRKLPGLGAAPRPVGRVHRSLGAVLFLATLPGPSPNCSLAANCTRHVPSSSARTLDGS